MLENGQAQSSNDFDVIQQLIRGDQSAWSDFVAQHTKLVYSAIRRTMARYSFFSTNDDDIDDLHASVFASLIFNDYRKLRQFKGKCSLASWLHLIAVRKTVDHIRSKIRDPILFSPGTSEDDEKLSPEPADLSSLSSSEKVMQRERIQVVRECIAKLPARDRAVLGFYCDNLSAEEIGRIMNLKANNVYQIQHRALQRLKYELNQIGYPM